MPRLATPSGSGGVTAAELASVSAGGSVDGLIMPVMLTSLWTSTAPTTSAVNRLWLARAVVPKAGTFSGLWLYNGATVAGNVIGAVYDTSATRQKLWDGGSIAQSGTQAWQSLGNPALTVTLGQVVEIGFMTDSGTATFGRVSLAASATNQTLPSAFDVGAAAKLVSSATLAGFAADATVAEGSLSAIGAVPLIIGRVS